MGNTLFTEQTPVVPETFTESGVFGLKYQDKQKFILSAKNDYKPSDPVTVDSETFNKRLQEVFAPLFDDSFDWDNVIFAGGFLSGLLSYNYDPVLYKNSDINLFVYGTTEESVKDKMQEVYDYFMDKFDKNVIVFTNKDKSRVLNVLIPDSVKVVGCLVDESPMEVIESFDMTHCQVYYDGTNVHYTDGFVKAVQTRVSEISTTKRVHLFRILKAYKCGFSVAHPGRYLKVINKFHRYSYDKPSSDDKSFDVSTLQDNIDSIMKDPIVVANFEKNYVPTTYFMENAPSKILLSSINKHYNFNSATIKYFNIPKLSDSEALHVSDIWHSISGISKIF